MIGINEIKQTLNTNPNITEEVKGNIIEIMEIFIKNFSNVDLTNFNNRLSTLKIEESNKLVHPGVAEYNPVTNILRLSSASLEEGDAKHILTHQLLNVITAKDDYVGFANDPKYQGLNKGFTEIMTNNLVGNESDISYYEIEVNAVNMVGMLVGFEVIVESFFNNDVNILKNKVTEMGGEV